MAKRNVTRLSELTDDIGAASTPAQNMAKGIMHPPLGGYTVGGMPGPVLQAQIDAVLAAGWEPQYVVYADWGVAPDAPPGSFALPAVSLQPVVAPPSLVGVSTGAFTLPAVSVQPVVAAPLLSGIQGGMFSLPPVQIQPVVAAPSLAGISTGAFALPAVSVQPVVAAPMLSGVQGGMFSLPPVQTQPVVAAPELAGISSGAFDLPAVSVQPVITAPSLLGVQAAPTQPVISVTAGDGQNVIALTSGGTGATSYELKYRVSGGSFGAYSTVTLPHTQTGLVNGTTYGFILKAINAGGSVESAEVSGTPVAAGNYSDTSFDGAANNATSFGGWTTFVGSNATSAISTAEGHTSAPSWGLSAGNGEEAGYGALRRTITTDTRNMTFWYKSDLGSIDQGTLRVKQGVALKAEHTILTTPELFDGDWHQVPAPLTAGTNAVIEISIDSFGGGGWVDDISIPVP